MESLSFPPHKHSVRYLGSLQKACGGFVKDCQPVFKPECKAWDHAREFQDPEGCGGGHSHVMKDPVVLCSGWRMWFEGLWELKLSDLPCNQNLNPQVCRSGCWDTAHVTWLPPDVCFSCSQKKKWPKQSSWASS